MPRKNLSALWNYFKKTGVNQKAKCVICGSIYNYEGTTGNLKSHLKKMHPDAYTTMSSKEQDINSRYTIATKHDNSRLDNRVLWAYFDKINKTDKKAKCRVCGDIYSFKATTGNLTQHLKNKHFDEYNSIVGKQQDRSRQTVTDSLEGDNAYSTNDDSDLWGYFEKTPRKQARCAVCRAVVKPGMEMKKHLKKNHPKVAEHMSDISVSEEDESMVIKENPESEENVYTEVVNLDEKLIQSKETPRQYIPYAKNTAQKKKLEPMTEHVIKAKRAKLADDCKIGDDELNKFGSYVITLLKNIPKDICTKLQMDIVSMIMTAKLKLSNNKEEPKTADHFISLDNLNTLPNMPGAYVVLSGSQDTNVKDTMKEKNNITNSTTVDNNYERCDLVFPKPNAASLASYLIKIPSSETPPLDKTIEITPKIIENNVTKGTITITDGIIQKMPSISQVNETSINETQNNPMPSTSKRS